MRLKWEQNASRTLLRMPEFVQDRSLWFQFARFFAQRPSRPRAVLSISPDFLDKLVVWRTYAALNKAAKESCFKRSP